MYESIDSFLVHTSNIYSQRIALYIHKLFRIEKYSYHDLLFYTRKVGTFLDSLGVKPGDRILIWAPNIPE